MGLGFKGLGLGCEVRGLEFRDLGFRVLAFRVLGDWGVGLWFWIQTPSASKPYIPKLLNPKVQSRPPHANTSGVEGKLARTG